MTIQRRFRRFSRRLRQLQLLSRIRLERSQGPSSLHLVSTRFPSAFLATIISLLRQRLRKHARLLQRRRRLQARGRRAVESRPDVQPRVGEVFSGRDAGDAAAFPPLGATHVNLDLLEEIGFGVVAPDRRFRLR